MNPLTALGYAVFERGPDGSLRLSGTAPAWLPSGCLTEAFPFLEVFLPDAEEFWASPGNRPPLYSDLWTQNAPGGTELHLCAIAIAGEQQFLLIECAEQTFQHARSFVQYAHEASLAREQIAKLTEAKSEFLARMSHEIRTPMNALLGMAELLAETPLNDEQREYVRVFRRAGDNLLNVINDILDFSKVEAGQIELEKIDFDLADILAEALEIAGVRARAKGLNVSSRIQPGVPTRLIGDPGRLRQILLNLLGNATKFTDRGQLTVLVEMNPDLPGPGALHFAVSDTGVGIPADRLASIFESFSQGDVSTARKYGGTGLGLAISKRFVELMGGRIWAESAVGIGSTMHFTAEFSVARDAAPKPVADRAAPAVLRNHGLRILLADDSEENRFLIRGYLKDSGCIIDEVENGAQAVEQFKQRAYDIVLMDAEMPVLDGYGATREIRALGATPVFLLTAHAFREARDRAFTAGCTAHLTKPIKKATLLEAINKLVPTVDRIQVVDRIQMVDRIPVSVESWLKPVVGGYLEKRRGDIAKLRAAVDRGDFSTIRTLGHQMSGTGGGYGFEPITEIGSALEDAALGGDATRIQDCIAKLEQYLDAVRVE
jgi:signal transduction histidine kinase/CheY-like chemotaxis protein/HPt (histidine-containing phosphotransfer) domain-containing protein